MQRQQEIDGMHNYGYSVLPVVLANSSARCSLTAGRGTLSGATASN